MSRGEVKSCARCQQTKARDSFYVRKDGHADAYCKQCRSDLQKEMLADPKRRAARAASAAARYLRTRERSIAVSRNAAYRRKYGISHGEFVEMVREAGNKCAICCTAIKVGGPRALAAHLDHCHRTGAVRGVLCFLCNSGIGKLRDDPAVVRRAAEYLERAKCEGRG